jgi:hypothetical protein
VATKSDVEDRLRALIGKLDASDDGARSLADALPDRRILELRLPDLDQSYWAPMEEGHLGELRPGVPPSADIRIRADSDDLVALIDGDGSLFSAYLAGRLRIDASVGDLLRLRKLLR